VLAAPAIAAGAGALAGGAGGGFDLFNPSTWLSSAASTPADLLASADTGTVTDVTAPTLGDVASGGDASVAQAVQAGNTPFQNAVETSGAAAGANAAGGSTLGSLASYAPYASLAGGALSGLGSLVGGNIAANAANKAVGSLNNNLGTVTAQNAPYNALGTSVLPVLAAGEGVGPSAGGVNTGQFTHTFTANDLNSNLAPNYQFMLSQGLGATANQLNASSGNLSGNALQGINTFAQNYAGNAYQNAYNNYQTNQTNIFNRLASVAGIGQTAAGTTAQATGTLGTAAAGATSNVGQAQAAGLTGATGNLASGASNALGWYTLGNLLNNNGATAGA
jgi:hypothetical protein